MTAADRKAELRKAFLARRRLLQKADVITKSKAATALLQTHEPWEATTTVCVYVSYGNEVSTHALIYQSLRTGKRLLAPKVEGARLNWYVLKAWEDLAPGAHKILEPVPERCTRVDEPQPDLVLVPGLAFDRCGHRLGHGSGYYDRFLEHVHCPKIGLTYDCLLTDALPSEDHDVHVDWLITESGVFKTRA